MKKVCMIEYQGRCDRDGKAVGHAPKVLREYMEFIRDDCEISVLAPKVILKELPKKNRGSAHVLPYHIVMKGRTPIFEKITNKLHMFSNIHKALKYTDAETVWFFNVEYYLMLYLFLHRKPKQRVVCTLFLDGYRAPEKADLKMRLTASVKQWVFEQAQKKIDLIISTGKQFTFKNCRKEYLPDYYDRKGLYDVYRSKTVSKTGKKELAVCLGTMGNGKQLEEMTAAFVRIGYPLKVAGRFYDTERVEALRKIAEENVSDVGSKNMEPSDALRQDMQHAYKKGTIEIIDAYLSQEEYLTALAEAKYAVLPYPPVNYAFQTSGVMQEAVFMDTVPVTYQAILSGNGIPGVGFGSWDELNADRLMRNTSDYLEDYRKLRDNEYSEQKIREKYRRIFAE